MSKSVIDLQDMFVKYKGIFKKWQLVGNGTSLAFSSNLACPTVQNFTIDNIGEIRHLSNRFHGPENENPGALAGATGANKKACQLQGQHYTEAPAAARRADQNGNWNRARWGWIRQVRADCSLSPMARLLANMLVDQFSHHETAHCAPGTDTLADALGTSVDTIKRALRDLAAAGWLTRTEGRGRGNRAQIYFLGGNNVVPMNSQKGRTASENDQQKGCKSAPSQVSKKASEKGANLHYPI
mgnify:CR=1 FL=1